MGEMSRRFNFDDFDELCREALEEHYATDAKMAREGVELEEQERWAEHDRVQDIGGAVIDLNANVVDLRPPDSAA